MATYLTLGSGYCTGREPTSDDAAQKRGGLRMYWELRCYTQNVTGQVINKKTNQTAQAGNYYIYYKLEGWHGITYSNKCRIIHRTDTSNASYVYFRNGTTNLWTMTGVTRSSSWNVNMSPGFGNNNPALEWYTVEDATYSSDYKVYPTGLLSADAGQTYSLNLTYSICINAGGYNKVNSNQVTEYVYYDANDSRTSSSTSVSISGGKFTLSTDQGSNSTITVNRTSSPGGAGTGNITSSSPIYKNDVLKITFSAATGYNIGTHTVNGSTFTSNNTHTVSANVTVKSTATVKTYDFTKTVSNGTISVQRTESYYGNGAKNVDLTPSTDKIYYGDKLKVTYTPNTAYNAGTCKAKTPNTGGSLTTVTSPYTSSSRETPDDDNFVFAFTMTPTLKSWPISITTGSYANKVNFSVRRTASPLGAGATNVNLANGSTVYYNDTLQVNWVPTTGYSLGTHTVNNVTKNTGATWSATSSPAVVLYGVPIEYKLTLQPTDSTISVSRTNTDITGAPTGALSNNATIYYNDKLDIAATPNSGYQLATFTINDINAMSSNPYRNYSVPSNVKVTASCQFLGAGYVKVNGEWVKSQIYILTNGTWKQYQVYILQNGQWVQCQ